MTAKGHRVRTYDAGKLAESFAVAALRIKGYRIFSRRWKSSAGEVDIIALSPGWSRARTLAFVEVKRRSDFDTAAESIRLRQRRRIMRAADSFLAAHPRLTTTMRRFDLILVAPGRWPHHVIDAWHEDDACV